MLEDAESPPVNALDAADYLFDLTSQLSAIARAAGLTKAAGALDQARAYVAEAILDRDHDGGKAAAGDAA